MKRIIALSILITLLVVNLPVFAQNGSSAYPAAQDTECTLFPVKDGATTRLRQSIASNSSVLVVESTALFPTCGYLRLDGRETVYYSGKTATTFTGVTRAREGTAAIVHAANVKVEMPISAAPLTVHSLAIRALQAKVGITSSTPSLGAVLKSNGPGSSIWALPALDDNSDVVITTPQTNEVLKWNGSAWVNGTVAGTGTVISVAASAGGIFSFTGTPVTSSGTLALSVTGTSGGIPYFSSGSALASSAALAANRLVLGGGAGAAPTALSFGTGNQLVGMNPGATANEYKTLALGTSGTNASIAYGSGTITLHLPNASGVNRGLLTAADFTTFNNKLGALSFANDTNVTGSYAANVITLNWLGALAKSRQHAQTAYHDQANTWSTGLQDFSAATLKAPISAGAAPTTSGLFAYDSTANVFSGGHNGANRVFVTRNTTEQLDNKTLANPTINGAALSGTFSGNPTFSGSPIVTGSYFAGKFRDTGGREFNVKAPPFNAVGDCSTNDAPAFAAAIAAAAAAGGGEVIVPQVADCYAWASLVTIGDGTGLTISTYDGVSLRGVGGTRLNSTVPRQAVKIKWTGSTSTSNTALKVAGPMGGFRLENIVLDLDSKAGNGIQVMHAEGAVLRNIQIVNFTNIGLDIDAYDTTTFGANTVFNSGNTGIVENLFTNTSNNNTTSVRLGATGNIAQWNFYGGRWRQDGTTGSNVVVLGFADHNNFWGVVGAAEVGVRVKPISGQAAYPVNNHFWSSPMVGSTGANAYVIDNSVTTWAPTTGYGMPLLAMSTADGAAVPSDGRFWGFSDTQKFFGPNWEFITALRTPALTGGTALNATLTLKGSSNASSTNAHILLNPVVSGSLPGAVLIGATSPVNSPFPEGMHLQGTDGVNFAPIFSTTYGGTAGNIITGRTAGGTFASPSATPDDAFLAGLSGRGYDTAFATGSKVLIGLKTAELWAAGANGTKITFETTPIGGTTRSIRWTVDSAGNFVSTGVTFANLGTPANGSMIFCSDCAANSNPCTGSSTGAFAKRLNGAWDCR